MRDIIEGQKTYGNPFKRSIVQRQELDHTRFGLKIKYLRQSDYWSCVTHLEKLTELFNDKFNVRTNQTN